MSGAMEVDKENFETDAAGAGSKAVPSKAKGISADDNREAFSPELLRLYYARLFPYSQVCASVN